MNSTMKLLERVRAKTETRSDYAVSQLLGISRSRMSKYMCNGTVLEDDDVITRAAELIGENPAAVLAEFHAERSKNEKARFYWNKLATLARQAAPLVLVAGVMASPPDSLASPSQSSTYASSGSGTMYIMLNYGYVTN